MEFQYLDLKIIKINSRIYSSPYGKGISLGQPKGVKSVGLVEVITNANINGIGETYSGIYLPEVVNKTFSILNEYLRGKKISELDLNNNLIDIPFVGRSGIINSCLSAVNIALWDIIGKFNEKPTYKVLNNDFRSKVPVYASGGSAIFKPNEIKVDVNKILNKNFNAYKMRVGYQSWDKDLERIEIARKYLNKKILMIDAIMGTINPSWKVSEAIAKIKQIEIFTPYWIEEPLNPNNIIGLKKLKKNINTPIAVGEAYSGKIEFEYLSLVNSYNILQIDVTHSGGMLFCNNLIKNAKKNNKEIALHVWGSAAALSANLQLAFSNKDINYCEFPSVELAISKDIWIEKPKIINGYIKANNYPGLGIKLPLKSNKNYFFIKNSGYILK